MYLDNISLKEPVTKANMSGKVTVSHMSPTNRKLFETFPGDCLYIRYTIFTGLTENCLSQKNGQKRGHATPIHLSLVMKLQNAASSFLPLLFEPQTQNASISFLLP